jgi:hypothetical protein
LKEIEMDLSYLPLATTVYMPLWGAIVLGVVTTIVVIGLVAMCRTIAGDANKFERRAKNAEDRCSVLENRDQNTIRRVIAEEVAGHTESQELINIMRSAYETHYGRFREEMVNGFMDRSSAMMGDLTDGLVTGLMSSVQPIYNDVGGESNFILPNGIKHAYQKGRSIVVLIENVAGLRSATFTGASLRSKEARVGTGVHHNTERNGSQGYDECYRFNLSFPYTYFLFTFRTNGEKKPSYDKFNIFFRNSPLTSIKQSLYPAPLLNMGDNDPTGGQGYVCMGDSVNDATSYKSIAQMCDELITEWWSRAFHNDLNEGDFRDSPLGDVLKWQQQSEKDPYWACSRKWKHGAKVRKILDGALRHEGASIPANDCRQQVEAAAYEMTKQINHTVVQLKPESYLTADAFEPAAVQAFQNSINLLTNKIIERIT